MASGCGKWGKMSEIQLPYVSTLFLECDCGLLEHIAKFSYDPLDWVPEEKDPDRITSEMWLHVHLYSCRGFLRRLWRGLKFAFGYRCRYGEWDEIIMSTMDVIRLRQFLNQYLDDLYKEGQDG